MYHLLQRGISPFIPNAPFLYPPKTSENSKAFWCFRRLEEWCIRNKWVKIKDALELQSIISVFDKAIYCKVMEIKWKNPDQFSSCVIKSWIFHTLLCRMCWYTWQKVCWWWSTWPNYRKWSISRRFRW